MPAWAAFGALTCMLIGVLLLLSVVSARAVGTDPSAATAAGQQDSEPPRRRGPADPVLPRFERATTRPKADQSGMSTGLLLANVALTQGLFGVALLGGALWLSIPLGALGLGGPLLAPVTLALGVGVGLTLWLGNELAAVLADAAGVDYDEGLRELLTPTGAGGWVLLLGAILPIIAIVEELLFRGAAIGALAAGFALPEPALVVASSVVFGAAHGAQGRVGTVVATALGLALGATFVLTGSLVVVIVAHYLVNALEFVVHEGLDVDRPRVGPADAT